MRRSKQTKATWAVFAALPIGVACVTCGGDAPADPTPAAAATPADEATRATMGRLFESLRVVLPLSVSEGALGAPEHRDAVQRALQELAANASLLASHAPEQIAGGDRLGRALERDAEEILARWSRGRADSAAFLVRQMTETCVACHASLPSPSDSTLAERFVRASTLARLPAEERARLEVATRRFEDAIGTLEALIASPDRHPAALLDPLTDYLTLCLRVKRDFARPAPVLERFAGRSDLWRNLRLDVAQWQSDLLSLQAWDAKPPDLANARTLMDEARGLISFPADRAALVHYIVASGILERYLGDPRHPPGDRAEAYYLLGLTETRIGRSWWVSKADVFLERAIRLAPHEPYAERAYALLEEETLLGYTGSGGVQLPADVARRLAELRRLIDADPAPR